MISNGLTCVTLVHNVVKIKYPWKYSILSTFPVCDRIVVVLSGPNDDGTTEELCKLAASSSGRIAIVTDDTEIERVKEATRSIGPFEWHYRNGVDCTWPDHANKISEVWNVGYNYVMTEWAMELQADEILAEWDYAPLLNALHNAPYNVKARMVGFVHFCGDLYHTFPFIYQELPKFCRTSSGIRTFGDAFALLVPANVHIDRLPVTYWHCSKVHVGRSKEAAYKEYTMQRDLYEGKLIPQADPKVKEAYDKGEMDFFKVFTEAAAAGQIKPYSGPYPEMVRLWAKEELGVELCGT